MDIFASIIACVLVLGLTIFILVTLYTIVRDLIRKKNKKRTNDINVNKEGGKQE